MSIAADFDSCGMARAGGGYDLLFALQLNLSIRFGLKLAPSLIGLLHHLCFSILKP